MTAVIGRGCAGRSRPSAFALVAAAYLLAAAVGLAVAVLMPAGHPLIRTLVGDIAATLVIFALSIVVNNASLYDPYWSVAPPVIVVAWLAFGAGAPGVAARQVAVVVLVCLWAVRLTGNWAVGWRGLAHEDWRYGQLREQTRGRLRWWLVNLTGIQLMPTLIVYIGLIAAWPAITAGGRPFGVVDLLATLVVGASIVVEAAADRQLRRFTAEPAHRGLVAEVGLWRRSRHPNYLGEIGFWCGIFLFGLAAAPGWWWSVVGPVTMIALFAGVSVPLMERRSMARRPAYAEYRSRVPALLPVPRRSQG